MISRFVLSRFYSIYFTVTLPGHRKSFVISEFVKSRFHCITKHVAQRSQL